MVIRWEGNMDVRVGKELVQKKGQRSISKKIECSRILVNTG